MLQGIGATAASFSALALLALTIGSAAPAAPHSGGSHANHAPGVIFSEALADVPGKRLVVVQLTLPPKSDRPFAVHRHPGSVYVYVTHGTARLGIQGQPVQTVPTGGSFFEPVGAVHTVGESASATEPATAIAVMLVPEGAPLVTPVKAGE